MSKLASARHELRTPLNAILGSTQLLLTGEPLPATARCQVDTIHQSAERLLALIDNVLHVSGAEECAPPVSPERIVLADAIDEAVGVIRSQAKAQQLYFQCTQASDLPENISVDPRCLQQVLANLIGHAIQRTSVGSVCLDVSRNGSCARFLIIDTGSDLSPEVLAMLLQPSLELEPKHASLRSSEFGLLAAKNMLERMGIAFQFERDEGEGFTCWFDLPLPSDIGSFPHSLNASPNGEADATSANAVSGSVLAQLKELATRGDILGLRTLLESLRAAAQADRDDTVEHLLKLTVECKIRAVREQLNAL